MSRAPDKDAEHAEHAERPTIDTAPAGRVEIDSRGHNVWRWAREVIESTSVLLKRLDVKDLALEPTQKVPVMRGAAAASKGEKAAAKPAAKSVAKPAAKPAASAEPATPDARHPALQRKREQARDGGGGFDPYNSR